MPKIRYSSLRAQGLWSLHKTLEDTYSAAEACKSSLEEAEESSRRNTGFLRERGKSFSIARLIEKPVS